MESLPLPENIEDRINQFYDISDVQTQIGRLSRFDYNLQVLAIMDSRWNNFKAKVKDSFGVESELYKHMLELESLAIGLNHGE